MGMGRLRRTGNWDYSFAGDGPPTSEMRPTPDDTRTSLGGRSLRTIGSTGSASLRRHECPTSIDNAAGQTGLPKGEIVEPGANGAKGFAPAGRLTRN
jgi:hypothetical protein